MVKKRNVKTKVVSLEQFEISNKERDEKKESDKTFMPFGLPTKEFSTDNVCTDNNIIFKGSWGLYGSGKPSEKPYSNLSVVDKYKPKSLIDIIGNKNNIKIFQKWILQKFENIKTVYDYCLITGESGSGKSEFIRQCFKDLNYSMIEYDQSINKAELEIIKETIMFSSIEVLLSGHSKKGIIIDNFQDNLSITQLTELLKILKNNKNSSPTIFVSSNESKLREILNGEILHIEFSKPNDNQLFTLGKKICEIENINISLDALEKFVNICDYELIGFLSTICMIGNKEKEINVDNLKDIVEITQKDIILDTQSCISMFVNPDDKHSFSFEERVNYATMHTSGIIQDNYLNMINNNISLEELSEISDYIVTGDVMKHHMLSNQGWNLSEITGIIGTEAPSSIIRKHYKPIKKYKIPNRYDFSSEVNTVGLLNSLDLGFAISNILFKLYPKAKWIKQMKKSSQIFIDFMKEHYINKDNAMKILNISYKFQNHDPIIIKKIKTKFRTEWKLTEN